MRECCCCCCYDDTDPPLFILLPTSLTLPIHHATVQCIITIQHHHYIQSSVYLITHRFHLANMPCNSTVHHNHIAPSLHLILCLSNQQPLSPCKWSTPCHSTAQHNHIAPDHHYIQSYVYLISNLFHLANNTPCHSTVHHNQVAQYLHPHDQSFSVYLITNLLSPISFTLPIMIYNDNNNNLYSNRVTQSNGKDLPWGPLACLQVAWGPQGYRVVQYIAFRYRDLKEGRDTPCHSTPQPYSTIYHYIQ